MEEQPTDAIKITESGIYVSFVVAPQDHKLPDCDFNKFARQIQLQGPEKKPIHSVYFTCSKIKLHTDLDILTIAPPTEAQQAPPPPPPAHVPPAGAQQAPPLLPPAHVLPAGAQQAPLPLLPLAHVPPAGAQQAQPPPPASVVDMLPSAIDEMAKGDLNVLVSSLSNSRIFN